MGADEAWGFVATLAACASFGFQYILLKGMYISDGMVFQWFYVSGVMMVGVIVNAIAGFYKFYPLAMLSGCLWAMGNVVTVPMFHFLGITPAFLLWTSVQMVVGWAGGRYGWFSIGAERPASNLLNYLGLGFSIVGGIFFLFVRNSRHENIEVGVQPENGSANSKMATKQSPSTSVVEPDVEEFLVWIPRSIRFILGVLCTVFAGFMYGVMFTPVLYIQARSNDTSSIYYGSSKQGIPYAFAYYTGAYATASIFLIIYGIYKTIRKQPVFVTPELLVKTISSGWIWGFATSCWLYANAELSEAITTPLLTRLPGVFQSLLGVFFFKEIRGFRNYVIVLFGTIIVIIGSILTGMSEEIET